MSHDCRATSIYTRSVPDPAGGVKAEFAELGSRIFATATVKIRFKDKILAGVPKNEDVLEFWMSKKMMSDSEKESFRARVKAGEVTEAEEAEIAETNQLVFERTPEGVPCVWHAQVKAMLRECFTCLGYTQKRHTKVSDKGDLAEKPSVYVGGKNTLQHCVHVEPSWLAFERDCKPLAAPDGSVTRVKHIEGPMGPRSAIGRHEYFGPGTEMTFVLKWPAKGTFSLDEIKLALALAQDDGLGASRSQGFGKFEVVGFEARIPR